MSSHKNILTILTVFLKWNRIITDSQGKMNLWEKLLNVENPKFSWKRTRFPAQDHSITALTSCLFSLPSWYYLNAWKLRKISTGGQKYIMKFLRPNSAVHRPPVLCSFQRPSKRFSFFPHALKSILKKAALYFQLHARGFSSLTRSFGPLRRGEIRDPTKSLRLKIEIRTGSSRDSWLPASVKLFPLDK